MKTQYLTSTTWQPFKDACMTSEGATDAQCSCLADYVHKHFSDREVQQIMDQAVADPALQHKIEGIVRVGSKQCLNP